MPAATELETDTTQPIVTDITESMVTPAMKAAAAADLKRQASKREKEGKLRTFKRGDGPTKIFVSDLFEFPADFDLDNIGPMSYLAQPEGEITGSVDTQTFSIKEKLLEGLIFEQPGRRLEAGRSLRTVKALKPNGILAQLPFEMQINNGASGEVADAIGLRYYARKGFLIFMDIDNLQPVYCFARNCHAAAMVEKLAGVYPENINVIGSGYCTYDHMVFTEPSLGREASGFSIGATTSRSWNRNK